MRTFGIGAATAIVNQASVCQGRERERKGDGVGDRRWTMKSIDVPLQVTLPSVPTFVNPVLQTHLTANVSPSCKQLAFESHPPFFTRQLSEKRNAYE